MKPSGTVFLQKWVVARTRYSPPRAVPRVSKSEPGLATDSPNRRACDTRQADMTTFAVDASWNQIKGKLQQRFAQLTDDDVLFVEGNGDELLGRLQSKLGMGAEEVDACCTG